MLLSYTFAIALPLLFLYFIWTLEIYAFSRWDVSMAAFGGGMVAFFVAAVAQNHLLYNNVLNYQQLSLFSAPLLEELLKAAILILMAWRGAILYTTQAATYGFAVGVGFGIAENLFLITITSDLTLQQTLVRVLSAGLMHAFTGAIIGALIGVSVVHGRRRRTASTLLGLLLTMLFHGLYNLAANFIDGPLLIVVGLAIGLGGLGVLVLVIQTALRREAGAIQRELNSTLSAGETAALARPYDIAHVIAENLESIGPRRAELLERYISLQSQRGILRKALSQNQRPRLRVSLRTRLESIERQIDALRSDMGLYNWVWLRSVLPSEESSVWASLHHQVDDDSPVLRLAAELERRRDSLSPQGVAQRITALDHCALFDPLSSEDRADIALMLDVRHYQPGQRVILQGTHDPHLYVVARGLLTYSITDAEGLETVIDTYSGGDHFGTVSLVDGQPHAVSVRAVDICVLYRLSRTDFMTLIYAQPQVAVALMNRLAATLREHSAYIAWARRKVEADPSAVRVRRPIDPDLLGGRSAL